MSRLKLSSFMSLSIRGFGMKVFSQCHLHAYLRQPYFPKQEQIKTLCYHGDMKIALTSVRGSLYPDDMVISECYYTRGNCDTECSVLSIALVPGHRLGYPFNKIKQTKPQTECRI